MPFPRASSALSRFTVLDLARVRSGPTCVWQLADWGAGASRVWLVGRIAAFSTIVLVGSLILPLARQDTVSRLVLCNSIFILFHRLASGRVCRDAILFALLGCAVGLTETAQPR